MDIKFVELKNGKNFIAIVDEKKEDSVVFNKAIELIPTGQGLQPLPWPMGIIALPDLNKNRRLEINNDDIMFIITPPEDITKNVREKIFGGIVEPSKELIL